MSLSEEERIFLKRAVLDSELDKDWSKAHKAFSLGNSTAFDEIIELYGEEVFNCARNIVCGQKKRVARVRGKVGQYVTEEVAVFGTHTFKPEKIATTKERTRRTNMSRCLRSVSRHYVANIDYGTLNQQEHYHSLFTLEGYEVKNRFIEEVKDGKKVRYKQAHYLDGKEWKPLISLPAFQRWIKNFGYVQLLAVPPKDSDASAVCKYVAKLSSHALKKSTCKEGTPKAPRLIYSRERE